MRRSRVVRVHFNKQGSKSGKPWTVHLSDRCIPAARVLIEVPGVFEFYPEKQSNPRAWVKLRGRVEVVGHTVRVF